VLKQKSEVKHTITMSEQFTTAKSGYANVSSNTSSRA